MWPSISTSVSATWIRRRSRSTRLQHSPSISPSRSPPKPPRRTNARNWVSITSASRHSSSGVRKRISRRSILGSGSLATGLCWITTAALTHWLSSCTTPWMVAGASPEPRVEPSCATHERSDVRSSLPSGTAPNLGGAWVRKNWASRASARPKVGDRRPPTVPPLSNGDTTEPRIDQRTLHPVNLDDVRVGVLLAPELLRALTAVGRDRGLGPRVAANRHPRTARRPRISRRATARSSRADRWRPRVGVGHLSRTAPRGTRWDETRRRPAPRPFPKSLNQELRVASGRVRELDHVHTVEVSKASGRPRIPRTAVAHGCHVNRSRREATTRCSARDLSAVWTGMVPTRRGLAAGASSEERNHTRTP
jgi:hypothetical protein